MIAPTPRELGVVDCLMRIEGRPVENTRPARDNLAMASTLPTANPVSVIAHVALVRPIAGIGPTQTLNSVRNLALPGVDARFGSLGAFLTALNDRCAPSPPIGGLASAAGASPVVRQVNQTNIPRPENRLQKPGMPPKANCPAAAMSSTNIVDMTCLFESHCL